MHLFENSDVKFTREIEIPTKMSLLFELAVLLQFYFYSILKTDTDEFRMSLRKYIYDFHRYQRYKKLDACDQSRSAFYSLLFVPFTNKQKGCSEPFMDRHVFELKRC